MLTDSRIRTAKSLDKSYKLTDTHGLYLMVSTTGSRLWYFRYRFAGKESRLAFGAYPQVTLAEAREKRDAARKLLASDISPSQLRKTEKSPLTIPGPLSSSPPNGTRITLFAGQKVMRTKS